MKYLGVNENGFSTLKLQLYHGLRNSLGTSQSLPPKNQKVTPSSWAVGLYALSARANINRPMAGRFNPLNIPKQYLFLKIIILLKAPHMSSNPAD